MYYVRVAAVSGSSFRCAYLAVRVCACVLMGSVTYSCMNAMAWLSA
jgi:hypothetical protein